MRIFFFFLLCVSNAFAMPCKDRFAGFLELTRGIFFNRDGVQHFDPLLRLGERSALGPWDQQRRGFWARRSELLQAKAVLELNDGTTLEGTIKTLLVTMTSMNERGVESVEEVGVQVDKGKALVPVHQSQIKKFLFKPRQRLQEDWARFLGAYSGVIGATHPPAQAPPPNLGTATPAPPY